MFDTSVESGSEVTPEVTGLYSWANDAENFGVSLFGSFQQRDSASVGAGNQDWNVERLDKFLNPANGRVRADEPAHDRQRSDRVQQPAGGQSAGLVSEQLRLLLHGDRA
jgi:hypothetical protein